MVSLLTAMLLCHIYGKGGPKQRRVNTSYHVESDNITKRDIASFVTLDKMLIDENWAAARRQTKHKWSLRCGIEGLNAFYASTLTIYHMCK